MPNPAPFKMPANAAEESAKAAGGRGYYDSLSPEERAEEGLDAPPAAPPEKPEAPPAETPVAPAGEPAVKPPAADPVAEREDPLTPAMQDLVDSIADLREQLADKTGLKTDETDPLLEAAAESEDPLIRGLAERLMRAEERFDAIEERSVRVADERQLEKDRAETEALKVGFTVDGAPLNDEHVAVVENWMLENPELGKRLSFEAATRIVFGDQLGRSQPKLKPPLNNGQPVAKLVDAPSGAPKPDTAPKGPYPSIEAGVKAAAARFGW